MPKFHASVVTVYEIEADDEEEAMDLAAHGAYGDYEVVSSFVTDVEEINGADYD